MSATRLPIVSVDDLKRSIQSRPSDWRSPKNLDVRGLEHELVHEAEAPIFSRFEAAHDGMLGLVEMLCGVPVLRIVTAADVTALETEPQVHPLIPTRQTLLAPVGRLRRDGADLRQMLALLGHVGSSSPER